MPAKTPSFVSMLPVFKVKTSKEWDGYVLVECPRKGCFSRGKPHVVHEASWRRRRVGIKGTVIRGRVCPYCHKVARMPPKSK